MAAAAPLAVVFAEVEGSATDILTESQTRVAVDGAYGTALDRPPVLRGAPLDHRDPRAVEISESVAEEHDLEPGDELILETLTAEQIRTGIFEGQPVGEPAGPKLRLRVSGVVRPTNELLGLTDEGGILLTRALWEQQGDPIRLDGTPTRGEGIGGFANVVLVRSRVGETEHAIAAAKRVFAGDDELFVERTAEEAAGVRDLARVVAIALTIATAIVALATVVVALQAIARHMAARAEEGEVLVAIGLRPRERVVAAVLPVAVTIAFSAVVAGIVAALLSARFPFGDLRRVEPSPGHPARRTGARRRRALGGGGAHRVHVGGRPPRAATPRRAARPVSSRRSSRRARCCSRPVRASPPGDAHRSDRARRVHRRPRRRRGGRDVRGQPRPLPGRTGSGRLGVGRRDRHG